MEKEEKKIGKERLSFETGLWAKQANGSCTVKYGDTVVLVAVTSAPERKEGDDFLPLTVEYQERNYAIGKIPGGFFKREGRQSTRETLCCRLVDRAVRPLFPDNYYNEVQICAIVLSADSIDVADVLSINGASLALMLSDIPFCSPIGAVRIAKLGDSFLFNPTYQEVEESEMDFVVAGTLEAIIMIEGGFKEVSEEVVMQAIEFARQPIDDIIAMQKVLVERIGKPKGKIISESCDEEMRKKIMEFASDKLADALFTTEKLERNNKIKEITRSTIEHFCSEEGSADHIKTILTDMEKKIIRQTILSSGRRVDERMPSELRAISCQTGILPRTHGSAVFTRGQTQSLTVTTLGITEDKMIIDTIEGRYLKSFFLHYNFPSFSIGETKAMRGPGRREIGHGALAERALLPVIPHEKDFPYTIRVVSDILESNGSTSMASVCAGSLSLMDAGVPIKSPVAGISIGLIKEGDKYVLLTDISGIEDNYGDMDFKVAGSTMGITAIQLDLKIDGLSLDIIRDTLDQAKKIRLTILDKMAEELAQPKEDISAHAAKIVSLTVPQHKIKDVIGPGGRVIRSIIEDTGVKINVSDDGSVMISGSNTESVNKAVEIVKYLTAEAEIGKVYKGKVTRVTNFGAFVEILPGQEGLVHISQLADYRVNAVEDIVKEGEDIEVKIISIDEHNRINLSRKAVLKRGV